MNNVLKLKIGFLFFIFLSCSNEKESEIASIKQSFDGIENTPEWLKLNVDEAFPSDDFNIWIPTNNFQTSALIKVPRFPRKYSASEIKENNALKDFEIVILPPDRTLSLTAVRNEQISAQIALGAKKELSNISIQISDFITLDDEVLSKENIQIRYVKYIAVQRARSEYVWSPKMEEIVGESVSGSMDPNVVADPLIEAETITIPAYRAQPVWITFKIPKTLNPGVYEGNITITSNEYPSIKHKIKLNIKDQVLPEPEDYKFDLDLWVNPSVIAEYYNLEHWSDKHWDMIAMYLEDYASRGGKNILTTITNEPWHKPWLNGTTHSQIEFGYRSMVGWERDNDGNWSFDYTIFDKYIDLASKLGINKSINAYSLTPFHTKQVIQYFDRADGKNKTLELDIEDKLYVKVWSDFLTSFKKHLINKGVFKKTYLGFDEKPHDVLYKIQELIGEVAPEFLDRIVIAGHAEATTYATNLSISYMFFPEQPLDGRSEFPIHETINKRKKEGKQTTFYLCAEPAHPNTLSYSPAIEAQLIPWLVLKYNTDGYLRWAYNNWTEDPFNKPVFIHNQGDDYYVYPGKNGPISSIRWELLKEGIEDYELFTIIKQNGDISDKSLQRVIQIATRNQDGRYKNVDDINQVRNILLKNNVNFDKNIIE